METIADPDAQARDPQDRLQLQISDFEMMVMTGIFSEETHLPQPLRISITADLVPPARFEPEAPLAASKDYMDLKRAAIEGVAPPTHFTLVEAVAERICDAVLEDVRVTKVEVKVVKLAIAEAGEAIGISLVRMRKLA